MATHTKKKGGKPTEKKQNSDQTFSIYIAICGLVFRKYVFLNPFLVSVQKVENAFSTVEFCLHYDVAVVRVDHVYWE